MKKIILISLVLISATFNSYAVETTTNTKEVIIQFWGKVDEKLPVSFQPLKPAERIKRGEVNTMQYRFTNLTQEPQSLIAAHRIQPDAAIKHFTKLVCFCFEKQTLAPGESKVMDVQYKVDKDLPESITSVTLGYTLFPIEERIPNTAKK